MLPLSTKYHQVRVHDKKTAWGTVTKPWAFKPIFHGPGHIRPDSFLKQKSLQRNNAGKKLYSWRSAFSICFASGVPLYNDAFLTYVLQKKYQNSENPGCMRPGPWKSCHPRKEQKNLPHYCPSSLDLALAVLCNCVLSVCGQGEGP